MSSTPTTDAAAMVTDAVMNQLNTMADQLAADARAMFQPLSQATTDIRRELTNRGDILPVELLGADEVTTTLAAVDGANVKEQLYAADFLLALAAASPGIAGRTRIPVPPARTWARLLQHDSSNDKIVSSTRFALEVAILTAVDADIRLLDGATTSPLLALSFALQIPKPHILKEATNGLLEVGAVEAVTKMCTDDVGRCIVAVPKGDSGTFVARHYTRVLDRDPLPGGDHLFATAVLPRGTMLAPVPMDHASHMNFPVNDDAPRVTQQLAADLHQAVAPLRRAAHQDRHLVTYAKPHDGDTVIKIEFRVNANEDARQRGSDVAARLLAEMEPRIAQEPLPQHYVDRAVKQVAQASKLLRTRTLEGFSEQEAKEWGMWLLRGYRT